LYNHVKDKPVAIFTGYKDTGVHKENIDGFRRQILSTPWIWPLFMKTTMILLLHIILQISF